jgi:hypothetical protein
MKKKHLLTGLVAAALLIAQIQPAAASSASVSLTGLLGVAAIDDAYAAPISATPDERVAHAPQDIASPVSATAPIIDAAMLFDADSLAKEVAAAETAIFDCVDVVALDDLAGMIGASGFPLNVLTDQTLTAVNTGNQITATQVGSGQITLDPNAFTGFSGIANFVINSGHNNNLQSSLSVNIVITQ